MAADHVPTEYTFTGGIVGRHNGSAAGIDFQRHMVALDRQYRINSFFCAGFLQARDVKLAHPDDGWVDRGNHILTPCYPLFDRRPQVGDKIALGSVTCDPTPIGEFRIVTATDVLMGLIGGGYRYAFDPAGECITVPSCEVEYDLQARRWRARPLNSEPRQP